MEFTRDRLTWIAYLVLAWFAYLQAAPGLVIGHLRDELGVSYATGGLHVAAFAAGSMVRRAARARARAAHAVLVGGRADGRGGDRVDGGADRRADHRLGAGHGLRRRA